MSALKVPRFCCWPPGNRGSAAPGSQYTWLSEKFFDDASACAVPMCTAGVRTDGLLLLWFRVRPFPVRFLARMHTARRQETSTTMALQRLAALFFVAACLAQAFAAPLTASSEPAKTTAKPMCPSLCDVCHAGSVAEIQACPAGCPSCTNGINRTMCAPCHPPVTAAPPCQDIRQAVEEDKAAIKKLITQNKALLAGCGVIIPSGCIKFPPAQNCACLKKYGDGIGWFEAKLTALDDKLRSCLEAQSTKASKGTTSKGTTSRTNTKPAEEQTPRPATKPATTEKRDDVQMCCTAMTPSCMACSAGLTVGRWCKRNMHPMCPSPDTTRPAKASTQANIGFDPICGGALGDMCVRRGLVCADGGTATARCVAKDTSPPTKTTAEPACPSARDVCRGGAQCPTGCPCPMCATPPIDDGSTKPVKDTTPGTRPAVKPVVSLPPQALCEDIRQAIEEEKAASRKVIAHIKLNYAACGVPIDNLACINKYGSQLRHANAKTNALIKKLRSCLEDARTTRSTKVSTHSNIAADPVCSSGSGDVCARKGMVCINGGCVHRYAP